MGMGMLFAGALTGGAQAMGQMADQAIKREDDSLARQQSIMDRRNELLFEMKAKADMAREQERADAEGYVKAYERGRAIGDDRRFSKFREDVRSTGGGEGMSEDELRGVFNENYNDKVVAGSDRYYEPESADKRDALQAARSSGASGKVIAGLNEEYRGILGAERQAKQDADRDARDERRYAEQRERDMLLFGQRKELQGERIAAQEGRSSSKATAADKPLRFDDAQKAELAPLKRDMDKAADEVAKARPSQRAAAEARAQAARDAYDNKVAEFGGERQKPAAQKSTVKDNQSSPPMSALQAGKVTTFANGQKWTVENGKPKRVN